jgi:flagellar protein FliO/FliZ
MTPALLALTLSLADPVGFPPPAAVTAAPPPSAAAVAALPVAAAAPATPPLTLPASAGPGLDVLILPVAALLALALAALFATRRKQQGPRFVRVLESTSIGPKRSLVVAQVGDEIMVIGSSEAGLQLLAARPSGLELRPADAPARLQAVPDAADAPAEAPAPARGAVLGLLSRLRGRSAAGRGERSTAPTADQGFDALLAESTEDLELRRKLALGQAGSVR